MARAAIRYLLLALLCAAACFLQGGEIGHLIHVLTHENSIPVFPFGILNASRTISNGPLAGDQLLALNGKPISSINQVTAMVNAAGAGGQLRVTVVEPSGRARETMVRVPSAAERIRPGEWAMDICTRIVIPIVVILLGFGVTAIRSSDPNAWIMLFMLLGFSEVFQDRTWQGPLPDLTRAWTGIWISLWPAMSAWFGLRFPERFQWDRKHPWIKFAVMAVSAVPGAIYFALDILWRHDMDAAQVWRTLLVRSYFVWLAMTIAGISVFFWSLGARIRTGKTADSKRRLRILYLGSIIAFTPALGVALYGMARGRDPFSNVPWVVAAMATMVVALFPLTLAYVIVVERAMDLRFIIRRGLQYAVARGGLYLVRAAALGFGFYIVVKDIGRPGHEALAVFQLAGLGLAMVVIGRRRTAGIASRWIDRKFFREAYDAEKVLSELANEAGRFVETGPLLEKVATRIGDTLHVPDIVILLRDGDTFRTAYTTRPGERLDISASSGIVAALGERREPLRVWFENAPPWIRALDARDLQTLDFMRTQLLLPVPGKDGLAGIMSLGPKLSEAPYSDIDIRLTRSIAAQMGLAVENARLLETLATEAAHRERLNREIEIAREVQERLFPQTLPRAPGVDCAGYCRPARGVGGDYYDFLALEAGRIGIAIGDVSGKGIAAALLMASLQASLRGQAAAGNHDLALLMKNVNRLVYEASTSNRYATFFYGEYDPATRGLSYVNAGHNPPIVLRGKQTLRLEATGPVVGLLPGADYRQETVQLQPGDTFIGFTDGISEALNEREEEWEEDRLIAAARGLRCGAADQLIRGVFVAADGFTGKAPQYDDMTMVVMKLAPERPCSEGRAASHK